MDYYVKVLKFQSMKDILFENSVKEYRRILIDKNTNFFPLQRYMRVLFYNGVFNHRNKR